MCLIINKPKGAVIDLEWIANSFSSNPDGWGVMWSHNNKVQVKKGFKLEELNQTLLALNKDMNVAVHMRNATSGKKDLINCHPIRIGNGMWLMHNGIINIPREENGDWSDTKHFCELAVKPMVAMYPAMFGGKQLKGMLEYFVGTGNKLLIMRGDGETMIVNENQGTWKEKCWLSNTYSIAGKTKAQSFQGNSNHPNAYNGYGGMYGAWGDDDYPNSRYVGGHHQLPAATPPREEYDGHFCESCKTYIQAKKSSWTQAAGVGWLCSQCWDLIKDSIEAVKDMSLADLARMNFDEIMQICENFPETIAWALMANATDILKEEEVKDGQRDEDNSVGKIEVADSIPLGQG
jgi:hypothetical protein